MKMITKNIIINDDENENNYTYLIIAIVLIAVIIGLYCLDVYL